VLIVLTSGNTFPTKYEAKTIAEAQDIQKDHKDWTVVAIGIGDTLDEKELKAIASGSSNANVIKKLNFNNLRGRDVCESLPVPAKDNDPVCKPKPEDNDDDDDDILVPSK